ncbi:hypothetical protein [Neobacillus jeddahensis]|uniref:hypothetical protein n=1 Tax=Neobacillus jeddahensis TaxID=1461580 RepID=UPI00058C29C0|nr:hypothetical protein [Neobacillus jeddahensis]
MSFLVATLLRDLTCPANPPGVKRLPLQSTSLAHTKAGCQVQVAIFFKFMAANVSIAFTFFIKFD